MTRGSAQEPGTRRKEEKELIKKKDDEDETLLGLIPRSQTF